MGLRTRSGPMGEQEMKERVRGMTPEQLRTTGSVRLEMVQEWRDIAWAVGDAPANDLLVRACRLTDSEGAMRVLSAVAVLGDYAVSDVAQARLEGAMRELEHEDAARKPVE